MIETKNYSLTGEEIARYHRDGYLVVKNLYDGREMQIWKDKIITLLKDEGSYNNPSGVRVFFLHDLHPYFMKEMRDPKVVSILRQLIGSNLEFLSVKAVYKNEVTRFSSPWHQDWYYWKGANKTSVWIALDDATVDNGCVKMVPGSHKKLFKWKTVEDRILFNQRTDEKEIEGLPVDSLVVERGGVVFFHDRTLHAAHENISGADRFSFISTYRDASIKDKSTVWESSMVVSGESVNK